MKTIAVSMGLIRLGNLDPLKSKDIDYVIQKFSAVLEETYDSGFQRAKTESEKEIDALKKELKEYKQLVKMN